MDLTESQELRLDKLFKKDPNTKIMGIDHITNCPVIQHRQRSLAERSRLSILMKNGRLGAMGLLQARDFWESKR